MWNLKYATNDPICKTEIEYGHGEQGCVCQGGQEEKGIDSELGICSGK